MGSCVSVHRETESAFRLQVSPVEEKPQTVNAGKRTADDVGINAQCSRPGSKDDAFFDSQPWMDSDCEDDFVSICGDFTPSRGNTPVHPDFSTGVPQINYPPAVELERTPDSECIPASSPDKKKRLSELFKASSGNNRHEDEENALVKMEAKTTRLVDQPIASDRTPDLSVSRGGSERIPNGVHEEQMKSTQCCFPRLRSPLAISERKNDTGLIRSVA